MEVVEKRQTLLSSEAGASGLCSGQVGWTGWDFLREMKLLLWVGGESKICSALSVIFELSEINCSIFWRHRGDWWQVHGSVDAWSLKVNGSSLRFSSLLCASAETILKVYGPDICMRRRARLVDGSKSFQNGVANTKCSPFRENKKNAPQITTNSGGMKPTNANFSLSKQNQILPEM